MVLCQEGHAGTEHAQQETGLHIESAGAACGDRRSCAAGAGGGSRNGNGARRCDGGGDGGRVVVGGRADGARRVGQRVRRNQRDGAGRRCRGLCRAVGESRVALGDGDGLGQGGSRRRGLVTGDIGRNHRQETSGHNGEDALELHFD